MDWDALLLMCIIYGPIVLLELYFIKFKGDHALIKENVLKLIKKISDLFKRKTI